MVEIPMEIPTVPPASGRPPPRRPPWPAPPGARAAPSAAPGEPAPAPAHGTAALGLGATGATVTTGDAFHGLPLKKGGNMWGIYGEWMNLY